MKILNQKGFTLIELLVVIAIIGILSSIVLVSLRSATNKANRSSALATVSGLSGEFNMCIGDEADVQGPGNLVTGGDTICLSGLSTTEWPSLANTAGYCYDWADDGGVADFVCDDLPADITPADYATLQTFYINNFDAANTSKVNEMITCTWSQSVNLRCN